MLWQIICLTKYVAKPKYLPTVSKNMPEQKIRTDIVHISTQGLL